MESRWLLARLALAAPSVQFDVQLGQRFANGDEEIHARHALGAQPITVMPITEPWLSSSGPPLSPVRMSPSLWMSRLSSSDTCTFWR